MEKQVFERWDGSQVTGSMLQEASQLFSEHYGVWGEHAAQLVGEFAKAGSYVRLNKRRLRAEYLPDDTECSYVRVTVDGHLAGNAFACRWAYNNKIGLMSSHPAACVAAVKAFGSSIDTIRLDFIEEYAKGIMKASLIRYIKDAKLRGSLFDPENASGLVSSVDTGFWVDHTEPLEALAWVRDMVDWPLGDLHDGHEFLLVLEVRHRTRPKSRFTSS
ncbi:MAG: hypothetical protein Q9187_005709 [Circinaria calcarea]